VFDILIRNATLPDGRVGIDVGCIGGKIVAVEPNIVGEAGRVIDAKERLLSRPSSIATSTWMRLFRSECRD
jgi:cytosine/creatinine deaminase